MSQEITLILQETLDNKEYLLSLKENILCVIATHPDNEKELIDLLAQTQTNILKYEILEREIIQII